MTTGAPTRQLFGIPIAAVTMEEAVAQIEHAVASRTPLQIGVVNAAKIVNMRLDAELREAVLSSDVVFADGMAVVWAGRVLGQPLPGRIAGIDLMHAMLARGDRRGWKVFCLGAKPHVLERTLRVFGEMYPHVQFVGAHHGYFTADDEPALAARIAAVRPDILLVAMTSPKKERFLARWTPRMDVPVCHGVGGSFDVVAGEVRRAPAVWQRLGLEWLYRVKQEPGRLWKRYLVTNTLFVRLVLGELVRGGRRAPVA